MFVNHAVIRILVIFTRLVFLSGCTEFFVTPTALFSGNGSISNPIELNTILSDSETVKPGDTIFLMGGTYQGRYRPDLFGSLELPIIVRNYENERVIIDGMKISTVTENIESGSDQDEIDISVDDSRGYLRGQTLTIDHTDPSEEDFVLITWPDENTIRVRRICPSSVCQSHAVGAKIVWKSNCVIWQPTGEYTWFMGLEIMGGFSNQVQKRRDLGWDSTPSLRVYGAGTHCFSGACANCKLINSVLHDCGSVAIGDWSRCPNSEIYGNIIYYNGWDHTDRGHGHAFYLQNVEDGSGPVKHITDNIMFSQFCMGMHTYGNEEANLDNFEYEGNIAFLNGQPSVHGLKTNFLVGGETDGSGTLAAKNQRVFENYCWSPLSLDGVAGRFSYGDGIRDSSITSNVFVSGDFALSMTGNYLSTVTATNNKVVGRIVGFTEDEYNENEYWDKDHLPYGETWVYVRPNLYDENRANVVIYNWNQTEVVEVDVSSFLKRGEKYFVKDVENYFGPSVLEGTYRTGNDIPIPMNLNKISEIQGILGDGVVLEHTTPEFGVYVIFKGGNGGNGSTGSINPGAVVGIVLGLSLLLCIVFCIFIVGAILVVIVVKYKGKES